MIRGVTGIINVGGGTVTGVLPVANGGTGRNTSTTAYALLAAGTTATGAHQTLAAGATTEILVGGGAAALPVWTTAQGSGAPVRATSPTLVTPTLGAALATSINGNTVATDTGALPVYKTGTWTPTVTSSGGTITTVGTVSGVYYTIGDLVFVSYSIAITDNGSGTGHVIVDGLPFASSAAQRWMGAGYNSSTAVQNIVTKPISTSTLLHYRNDGGYPVASGQSIHGSITYVK